MVPEPTSSGLHVLLRGGKVRLDALTEGDLPTVTRWQRNSDFMRRYNATPAYPKTEVALREWLRDRQKDKTAFLFAIRLIEGDELIGYIEIEGVLWAHQTGWLSIAIGDPMHWGQGYGSEAMRLALAFAFEELNLHRLQLTVFSYNRRAIALYEKLGFRREGVFREFLQRDGMRHDMLLYGLLRHEFARG